MIAMTSLLEKTPVNKAKMVPAVDAIPANGFDVQSFVEAFPLLAGAEGGVEGLKALTLHLAVRGLLVEHDRRADVRTADSVDLTVPYAAPPGWAWRRVDEVGEVKLGRQRSPQNHQGPHMRQYLRVANVHEARIDTSDILEMNFDPAEAERFSLRPGDILLNEGQSYELVGRPAIYRGEVPGACFQNTLIRFRPTKALASEYALIVFRGYMRTGRFRREAQQTTNIAHLSAGRLAGIEFPLPTLAEQKRIVAKVDELMRLIDDLEAKQTKKREVQTQLRTAALDALTSAEGGEQFEAAWQRVAENFQTLFERRDSVASLRRSILEVAVRGKLGRQHQGDVPAQKLWARIQDEHAASREGRRRGGRSQADEGDEPVSEPYPLPSSWLWCRLGDVAGHIVDGTHHTPKYTTEGIAFISAKDIRQGRLVFDNCKYISDEEFKKLAKRCRPKRGDLLVTKSGSIGEVAVVDGDRTFTLFESVALVPIVPSVDHEYAARVVYLGASGQFGKDHQKGVGVPHLHLVDLRRLPFPLPPLEEQKRIVAKVEHLMKLCDDLEAKLGRAEETAATLVEAVVSKMVA